MLTDVKTIIENNEVGQLYLRYSGPVTITFSSESMQLISQNENNEVEAVFIDNDFEILHGSK